MNEGEVLGMVAKSEEFEQVKVYPCCGSCCHTAAGAAGPDFVLCCYCLLQVREDELSELDELLAETCRLPVKGGTENAYGKVNVLMQTFISRGSVDSFSLTSDLAYVAQVGGGWPLSHFMHIAFVSVLVLWFIPILVSRNRAPARQ